jgi:AAA family ATP:ADP antiporter
MTDPAARSFLGNLQAVFWPIHRSELKKFASMSALMFCILFNQNILRILKDSILISEISAEATTFAKVYCVTPAAALFVVLYAKMVNHLTFRQIFNTLTVAFVSFFIAFAYIIYPNIHIFHKDAAELNLLMATYPNFKWYIALLGNWSYIIFYTLSELWPNIFYILLFWQFANSMTSSEEAKRFYTHFSLFGNSSLVIVGFLMMNLSSEQTIARYFITVTDNKIALVQVSTTLVIVAALLSSYLVTYVSDSISQTDPSVKSPKTKMGLIESFKYISQSKYLWLMLICSAAFGLTMNLVESVWKAKIKELYPSVNAFAEFNSLYILWTGVAIMILTIVGNNIMRLTNWYVAAVISPLIIMITGTLFFVLVVFDKTLSSFFDYAIFATPLALAVSIGAIQNILAKGAKYSIWDTSREMLYIPLNEELKTKGKAAVDVVSSKVGKSASGLIQSLVFTIFPAATFTSIAPLLMIIFMAFCLLWVSAVKKIYNEYQKILKTSIILFPANGSVEDIVQEKRA